jgi:RimJ/RimL family protein N-acetyltransferase
MNLVSVYDEPGAVRILYDLLKERTPEQSISHKAMPSFERHAAFVASKPYLGWYLLKAGEEYVGSVYLSKRREVGIFLFESAAGNGYGRQAIALLRELWPGRLLANVNPANVASVGFFKSLGANLLQHVYELP